MANTSSQLARLKRENSALKKKVEALERLATEETTFALSVFQQMPITFWACDRDRKIVFWNKHAEHVYGYTKDEAIGKDFVDLFVDPLEAPKAKQDLLDIIDNDKRIQNIANDRDKFGIIKRVLTNCFAIEDPNTHSVVQVELSFQISNLQQLEAELESVRERGERIIEAQGTGEDEAWINDLRSSCMRRANNAFEKEMRSLSDKIDTTNNLLLQFNVGNVQRKANEEKLEALLGDKGSAQQWINNIQARLGRAKTADEMQEIGREIENWENRQDA